MFCKNKKFCLSKLYILFILFLLGLPNLLMANELEDNINALTRNLPPLSVQSSQDIRNISPYLRYAHGLDVSDAKSVYAQRAKFIPYNTKELNPPLGAYWFLLSFSPIKDESVSAAFLDLGDNLPKNSKIMILPRRAKEWQLIEDVYTRQKFHQEIVEDTELKKIESNINLFSSGLYDLTPLRQGGELLIYSSGLPGLWFSPSLVKPASAPITLERQITPILLLTLFALMFFSLWRGMREEGDARLWAAVLTLCALVQYSFGVAENPEGKVEVWSLVGVVCASLSIFLLPHIGRHYMITEKNSPNLDGFFQFLAIPAIFPLAVFFTPLPQYYSILYYTPLWGLYAFLPCFFTVIPALIGRKGAKFYFFFSLCIGLGALTGLIFRENPIFSLAPQAGLCVAMFAMFLAPRQSEKNVIEKKEDEHADPIRDFAEHNMSVREVFFRVEAKLREPFDRIMREACYLDVGTKSDEISDAIKILQEQNEKQGEVFNRQAVQNISDKTNKLQSHTDALVHACKDLSGLLRNMPKLAQKATPYQSSHELFNLKNLVLHACDAIRQEAQDKQIGLGWYIAPQMGLFYRGDKNKLNEVLGLLLRDAVRATTKGMISVRVRRANNPNPGHIVFTISDSGKGRPPVERSPLTLIKAWELSTQYNGEVELHSSPNGLSFSFSLECIAMDASGEKPVAFANLDEIVVRKKHGAQSKKTQAEGTSGGNLVFTRTEDSIVTSTNQNEKHTKDQKGVSQTNDTQANVSKASGQTSTDTTNEVSKVKHQETSVPTTGERQNTAHTSDKTVNTQRSKESALEHSPTDYQETEKKENILLVCPPAIQRQNIAWYINQYEIWEALDVDSALACYEAKPSKLVLVHSSLSANGCSAVIAGIRLLENSLGLSHTTFLGLYQSAKDMEFLRLAGCKHVLPGNIGREGLGMTVAEILQDPFLAPIENIETGHLVLKKDVQLAQKIQEEAKLAVEKCLNTKREFAGTVDDTVRLDFHEQEAKTDHKQFSIDSDVQTENRTDSVSEIATLSMGSTTFAINDTPMSESAHTIEPEQKTVLDLDLKVATSHDESTSKEHKNKATYPINAIDEEEFIQSEEQVLAREKAKEEAHKLEHAGIIDDTLPRAHFYTQAQQNSQKGLMSKIFGFMKPKPNASLQSEVSYVDDFVGEPTPIITNALKAQTHLQKTVIEEEVQVQNLEELYSDTFDANFEDEFVGEPADVPTKLTPTEVSPKNEAEIKVEDQETVEELAPEGLEVFDDVITTEHTTEAFAEETTEEVTTESSAEVITEPLADLPRATVPSNIAPDNNESQAEEIVEEIKNFGNDAKTLIKENVEVNKASMGDSDNQENADEDVISSDTISDTVADTVPDTVPDTVNDEPIDTDFAHEKNVKESDTQAFESDNNDIATETSSEPTDLPKKNEIETEETIEDACEEIAEETPEKVTVEFTENITEEIAEKVTEEMSSNPIEEPVKASVEDSTDYADTPSTEEENPRPEKEEEKEEEDNSFLENISRHISASNHEEMVKKDENPEPPLQDLLPFSSKFVTQQGYFKEDDLPKALFIQKDENNLLKHDYSDDFLSFDPEIQAQAEAEEVKSTFSIDSHEQVATVTENAETESTTSPSQNGEQEETDPSQDLDTEVMQLTEDMLLQTKNSVADNTKEIELELDLTPQPNEKNIKKKKENNPKLEILWDQPHNHDEQKNHQENNDIVEKNDPLLFFPENKK